LSLDLFFDLHGGWVGKHGRFGVGYEGPVGGHLEHTHTHTNNKTKKYEKAWSIKRRQQTNAHTERTQKGHVILKLREWREKKKERIKK
jgi:hypothetical protein